MNGRLLRHAFLAAAMVALPAGAQLYKWTDANGRVQYSDKPPPPGRQGERLSSSNISTVTSPATAGQSAAGTSGAKSAAEQEQEFRKRRADQAEAEKKAQQVAEDQRSRQEACQAAQRQLTALQSGQRMATIDASGERRFMEENDIQQASQRAQADVQKFCR